MGSELRIHKIWNAFLLYTSVYIHRDYKRSPFPDYMYAAH